MGTSSLNGLFVSDIKYEPIIISPELNCSLNARDTWSGGFGEFTCRAYSICSTQSYMIGLYRMLLINET